MAKVPSSVRVGHSPAMLTYLSIFFLLWAAIFFVFTATLAADKTPLVVIPTILLLLDFSVGIRALRVAVFDDTDKDILVLRNYFQTTKIQKRALKGFVVSDGGELKKIGTTVSALTRDGREITVDVFTRPLLSAGARARFEEKFATLKTWARR